MGIRDTISPAAPWWGRENRGISTGKFCLITWCPGNYCPKEAMLPSQLGGCLLLFPQHLDQLAMMEERLRVGSMEVDAQPRSFPPVTQWPSLGSSFLKPTTTSMNQSPLDLQPAITGSTGRRPVGPVHLHPMVYLALLWGIQLKGLLQSQTPWL